MASKNTSITIASANANDVSFASGNGAQLNIRKLIEHLEAALNGSHTVRTVTIRDSAVAASGTITLASALAGTVVLVNGVPFTALSGTATAGNNEWDMSGSDTADAASLAAAINASTTAGIAGVVTATSALGVVTVTASSPGRTGNGLTLETLGVAASQTVTYVTPSGAQTVVINGVTAYSATAGATATLTAAASAAAINASTDPLVAGNVRALSRAGVLWVISLFGGTRGNATTISATGTGATAGGARLTGGTVADFSGAQATGTLTVSGADGGTYTTTINGVAINATGTNGNDTTTAASIATAINASTNALVRGLVTATSAAGVVTVTAVHGGISGNTITTVATAGTGYTAGQARLTTGAAPTTVVLAGGTTVGTVGARLGSGSNDTAIVCTL